MAEDFSSVRRHVEDYCERVNGDFDMGGVGGDNAVCVIEQGDRDDFVRVSRKSDYTAMATVQSGRMSAEISEVRTAQSEPAPQGKRGKLLRLDGDGATVRLEETDVDFIPGWTGSRGDA